MASNAHCGACQRYGAGCAASFSFLWSGAYNAGVASFYCYILECADGSLYTGWTSDPERRLRQHNAGRGGRYTRSRRPLELRYLEPQPSRRAAMRRERSLKALPRQRKLALIREEDAPYDSIRQDRESDDQDG